MGSDVGNQPSYDTHLARLLHERGRVGVDVLQSLLARARADRDVDPSLSLAISLVQEGILSREEADGYLAELSRRTDSESGGGARPSSAEELIAWRPGGKIDRYTIGERIGQGGMGTVFRAERDGEQFAIKALPLGASEEGIQERFTREYEAQSKLNPHPNVVRVRGAGVAGGARYLVLDLATGGDLQSRLRKGPLPIREAVELGRRLALGLAHVHAHDILHRDLKPGNVLFDAGGIPKLVDFGLARSVGGAGNLTQTGELLGTPSYMAPEQAMAIRGSVGIQTDVYGLGAVLFHALTGRPPFVGASTLDVLTQAITQPAPRPSSIRASVPPALDAIILKCLAKEPHDRYPTADALAEALEQARLGGGKRVPKALVGAAIGSVLLAVSAVGVAASRSGRVEPAPVATETETALPAPPPEHEPVRPSEPLDVFAPRVGRKMTSVVSVRSKRVLLFDGIKPRDSTGPLFGEFNGEIGLSGEVTRASPTEVQFKITIERLRIRNVGGLEGRRLYDSEVEAHRKQPFSAALRKSFTFTMNPRTGAILKTQGAKDIQQAIYDAAPPMVDGTKLQVEFFIPSALLDALNRVWCCLPDPRPEPAMAWTVIPPDPQHIKALRSYMFLAFLGRGVRPTGDTADGPVPRAVKVTKRVDRALHVTWKGQKDIRRYRAEAVIVGGLVRYAKINEHIRFQGAQPIRGKERRVEWVFQNEYEATLDFVNPR